MLSDSETDTIGQEPEEVNVKVKAEILAPEEDIRKRIEIVVDSVQKFKSAYVETRKTVKEQLEDIVYLGINEYMMEQKDLRDLIDEVFAARGVSLSWLRRLLPDVLKDTSKVRLDYKHKRESKQREQQLDILLYSVRPDISAMDLRIYFY
jgi:hypothetical protein